MKPAHSVAEQFPMQGSLYGGFDAANGRLMFAVEASTDEEARQRVARAAPLMGFAPSGSLMVAKLDSRDYGVPTFLASYFEALRVATPNLAPSSNSVH